MVEVCELQTENDFSKPLWAGLSSREIGKIICTFIDINNCHDFTYYTYPYFSAEHYCNDLHNCSDKKIKVSF